MILSDLQFSALFLLHPVKDLRQMSVGNTGEGGGTAFFLPDSP